MADFAMTCNQHVTPQEAELRAQPGPYYGALPPMGEWEYVAGGSLEQVLRTREHSRPVPGAKPNLDGLTDWYARHTDLRAFLRYLGERIRYSQQHARDPF